MYFILLITILQHGQMDTFREKFKTMAECKVAQAEARNHNNSVTKVTAVCFRKVNAK